MAIVIVKLLVLGTGVLIEQILSVDSHERNGKDKTLTSRTTGTGTSFALIGGFGGGT